MVQTARPASDITTTNWTVTPLWSKLNDSSDTSTVRNANGTTSSAEVKLASVTDPVSSSGHTYTIRCYATGSSAAEKLTASLVQGSTVIATGISGQSIARTAPNIANYSYTLSAAEANSITDYTDLRLRFNMSTGGAAEFLTVSEVWLEVPNEPPKEPPLISVTSAIYAPTVTFTYKPPAIAVTSQVYIPTRKDLLTVSPQLISLPVTIYAPGHGTSAGVYTSQVYAPIISVTPAIYAPTARTTQVYAPLIDDTGVLYTPTAQTTQVYAPLIDQTAVLFTPAATTVGPAFQGDAFQFDAFQAEEAAVEPKPPLIDQTGVIYTPEVATTKVYAPAISVTPSIFAPSSSLAVSPAALTGAPTIHLPTVGSTVAPGVITQTPTLYAPMAFTSAVYPSVLTQTASVLLPTVGTSQVYAPVITQTPEIFTPRAYVYAPAFQSDAFQEDAFQVVPAEIEPALSPPVIVQTGVLYTPTVDVTLAVYPGVISVTPQVFAPSVARSVSPPVISGAPTIHVPTTIWGVAPGVISVTPQIFTPTTQTTKVYVPLISIPVTIYAPGFGTPGVYTSQVYAPVITGAPVIHLPEVDTGTIAYPETISITPQVFTPSVAVSGVYAPVITGAPVVHLPTTSLRLSAPVIAITPTIFAPAVATKLYLGRITIDVAIHRPQVIEAVATITFPGKITVSTVLFAPSITNTRSLPRAARDQTMRDERRRSPGYRRPVKGHP